MIRNLKLNKIVWYSITVLALYAAIWGLVHPEIYTGLMPQKFVAAQFAQDWLTILVSILLLVLIYRTTEKSYKSPIAILGIIGSLAYLYGIFSIERVYNPLYFVYLAIFGGSVYSAIYLVASFDRKALEKVSVPAVVRNSSAVFSLVIAGLFSLLWVSALVPIIQAKNQIQNLYSIYLLDLAFVMPAFVMTAVMTFRKKVMGYVLTPAMFILGIFVIFPLGLGELAKPRYGMAVDVKSMAMSFVLSGLFFLFAVWQLWKMEVAK